MEIDFAVVNLTDPDAQRQAEWRERSVEAIKKRRAHRLDLLNRERVGIGRATREYRLLDNPDIPWITLRRQFIRLDTPRQITLADEPDELPEPRELSSEAQARERAREIATRPPLTRLIHRQSNALALYMTAVYVAHLEARAGNAFKNTRHNVRGTTDGRGGWIWLSGLSTPRDIPSRRARVRRALDELVTAGLVNIQPPGMHYRYEAWTMLKEDGTGSQYRVPSEREPSGVRLPASFFLNGWHLVLTPGEIAMLLAITQMNQHFGGSTEPDGRRFWIALPQSVRWKRYGLSGEIYLNAQQLHEFGLVEFNEPMPNRRRGKIPQKRNPPLPMPHDSEAETQQAQQDPSKRVPYQWSPGISTVFNRDAFKVVHDTLSVLSLPYHPYRLDDNCLLSSPQGLVEAYRKVMQSR